MHPLANAAEYDNQMRLRHAGASRLGGFHCNQGRKFAHARGREVQTLPP